MFKNIINNIQYYLFVKKIILFTTMFFAFLMISLYSFLKSDYFAEITNYFLNKYLILRYGSIESLGLMGALEQQVLEEQIFITSFVIGLFPVFFMHIYSQVYVFRNITSKYYSIVRTNNLWDDVGFAITSSMLNFIFCYPAQTLFSTSLYKIISVLIVQTFIFHLLVKGNAYNYSVKKRTKPLKT